MSTMLKVNAGKLKDADGNDYYERSINVATPKVLLSETLADMVEILGEDYIMHQLKAQMKISYRGKIRQAMEKKDDNGEYEYDEDAILTKIADVDWVPELRIQKTAEEKLDETLNNMDKDKLEAYLQAKMAELQGATD